MLAFAKTVRQEPPKEGRRGLAAKEILTDKKVNAIIRELPEACLQELVKEVTELRHEAEKFGLDPKKMEDGIQRELNVVVSEIYSPPRVTRGLRGS